MRGGRAKLPILAEIAGPSPGDTRVWSLRRKDHEQLAALRPRLEGQRVVLVTGAEEVAGTLAVALAAIVSAAGRRTALLECDLARPRLAVDLGLAQAPGLHEYLRWEASAAEILQPFVLGGSAAGTATEPLICIAAGRPASDAKTLLGLQSFRHMTAKLRAAYDFVVLGGPPLDSDPASLEALAAQADCILAGIVPAQASGRSGRALRAALGRLPVPSLGAVVVAEA